MSDLLQLPKPDELTQALTLFGLGFVAREAYRASRGLGKEDAIAKAMWSLVASAALGALFSSFALPVWPSLKATTAFLVLSSRFLTAAVLGLLTAWFVAVLESRHFLYRGFVPATPIESQLKSAVRSDSYIQIKVRDDRTYTGLIKSFELGRSSEPQAFLTLQHPYVLSGERGGECWQQYPDGRYLCVPFGSIVSLVIKDGSRQQPEHTSSDGGARSLVKRFKTAIAAFWNEWRSV